MLYVQQALGPNEELVHVGEFHWMYTAQAVSWIFFGLALSIGIIIGALMVQYETLPFSHYLKAVQELHLAVRIGAFGAFLFGLWNFVGMMVRKVTTEIAVTDKRLIYKQGLIARDAGEISIDRIESVMISQGILARIFNYGRLVIRGMGVGEVVLPPIAEPMKFRKSIMIARDGGSSDIDAEMSQ